MEKKVAIITGGAGGIGSSVCKGFIAEGTRIVIADVDTIVLKILLLN